MKPKTKKAYLMTAGTLFPAMTIVAIRSAYRKSAIFDTTDLLLFAGTSIASAIITAKILK